jgi:TRAP-type C4-dicarboxylate transport system substrate-binding protein
MSICLCICHCTTISPLFGAIARGEPVTLRLAAIAPDGTAWARELKAFAREVESLSGGELKIKWYLGGIAGDELTALDRVRHGQIDGEAGAIFCQRLAPSVRVIRVVGLYQSRDEAIYVLSRLKPVLDEELRKAGFANLGEGVFGMDVLFSRRPVRALADLTDGSYWVWNVDSVWQATLPALGVKMTATSLDELPAVYQKGAIDGFFAMPSAALAFQWSTLARYVTPVGASILPACVIVANAALDPLPVEQQQLVRGAAAKFMARFNETSHELENELMNGLFERQGLTKVPLTPQLHDELGAAARSVRHKIADQQLPPGLLASVEKMLDEYRAQRRKEAQRRP